MSKSFYDPDIRIYRTHESVAYASAATRVVKLAEYRLPDEPELQPAALKQKQPQRLPKKRVHTDTAVLSVEMILLLVLVLVLTVTILQLGSTRTMLQESGRELQSLQSQSESLKEIIEAGVAERILTQNEQLAMPHE